MNLSNPPVTRVAPPSGTLPALVRRNAREQGDAPALTFRTFPRPGRGAPPVETTLSYAELDRDARAVATALRRWAAPGDRVALLCPHNDRYVTAFLGCLYAGVIAVPLQAPEPFRGPERVLSVLADCDASLVLTTRGSLNITRATLAGSEFAPLPLRSVEELIEGSSGPWEEPPEEEPDAIAYLQYTSGSTGSPAGVRISHGNLAAAVEQLDLHFPRARTAVSWVPFSHDMGLIFGIAAPLASGMRSVQISTLAFIQDPLRWLRAISDHAAEWTVAPNFGLEHCLGRYNGEGPRLDLGSLEALSIAGEPVRASTLDAFAAEFAPVGLRRSALAPCYGLAEATLAVTATPLGAGPREILLDRDALAEGRVVPMPSGTAEEKALRLVACGVPKHDVGVRVVDPHTDQDCPEGRVGQVWTRGPNNSDGYWRDPERSAQRFRIGTEEHWLDTGDLGFVHERLLYITGRSDDVLLVRGRNHYPEDIETTARGALPGVVAAFAADTEAQQRLVLIVEPKDPTLLSRGDVAEVAIETVRDAVRRGHGLVPHELVLVRRGSIPKTTSGKIQRGLCRERFLQGWFGEAG